MLRDSGQVMPDYNAAVAAENGVGVWCGVLNTGEKVMAVTRQIVERDKITTLMITHDMDYALTVGSRTIMLDAGKIVMDLSGEQRRKMTSCKLAELFYTKSRKKESL